MKVKSVKIVWLAAIVLFLCACPASALVEFNDGLTHKIDYAVDASVYVDYQTPAMYTTVNVRVGFSLGKEKIDGKKRKA